MQPTERFTNRVEDYVKYRPSYPSGVLDLLQDRCRLETVADVGSGTGILTKLLLERGATVYGVEPNNAMRLGAEEELADNERFHSVSASAEETSLPEACIDLYTASQAFHWFDPIRARQECLRILKPGGWVALIWNERKESDTPFLKAYEGLLQRLRAYHEARHQALPEESISRFLAPGPVETHSFPNRQSLDWDGLVGRAASSSYFPKEGESDFLTTMSRLSALFEKTAVNGMIDFIYDCQVFLAQPSYL